MAGEDPRRCPHCGQGPHATRLGPCQRRSSSMDRDHDSAEARRARGPETRRLGLRRRTPRASPRRSITGEACAAHALRRDWARFRSPMAFFRPPTPSVTGTSPGPVGFGCAACACCGVGDFAQIESRPIGAFPGGSMKSTSQVTTRPGARGFRRSGCDMEGPRYRAA
jgi:hypothetical protein